MRNIPYNKTRTRYCRYFNSCQVRKYQLVDNLKTAQYKMYEKLMELSTKNKFNLFYMTKPHHYCIIKYKTVD